MKIFSFFFCFISLNILLNCLFIVGNESLDTSKYIKEINFDTFNSTLENNNVFLEIYTQWCGHCRALDKVLVETAINLNGQNITIAKIDVGQEKNKEIANLLGVDSYPTFFFISEGQYWHYLQSKTTKRFTKYLEKELNTNITRWELKRSLSEIYSLSSDKKSLLLFIGDNEKFLTKFKSFRRIAELSKSKLKLFWTKSNEFYTNFNISIDYFGLVYYNYEYNQGKYGYPYKFDLQSNLDVKLRLKMFNAQLFNKIDAKGLHRIIDKGFSTLILLYRDENPNDLRSKTFQLINSLIPIAERYKADFIFNKMEFSDESLNPILENFEFLNSEDPTCIIYASINNELYRYKMNETLNLESFERFIENYKNHKLEKHINSDSIPSEPANQYGVLKIVRKTLNSTILENTQDIFIVLYCIDKSKRCQQLRQRFYDISKMFENLKNLKFAEYEVILNENDIIEIDKIPEIIYFPKSSLNKLGELKRFIGNYTSQEIIEFIKLNLNETNLIANTTEIQEAAWKNETKFSQNKIIYEEDEENEEKEEKIEDDNDEEEIDGEPDDIIDKEDDKEIHENEKKTLEDDKNIEENTNQKNREEVIIKKKLC